MSGAFPHKRVVHAGLNGTLVSPKETQSVWDTLMNGVSKRVKCNALTFIFRFVRQNAHIVASSKTVRVKSVENQYIDGLISELKIASERRD